jgi:hypothetical protein
MVIARDIKLKKLYQLLNHTEPQILQLFLISLMKTSLLYTSMHPIIQATRPYATESFSSTKSKRSRGLQI